MKNSLNKARQQGLFCFIFLLLCKCALIAQPIQLIPKNNEKVNSHPIAEEKDPSGFWEGTLPSVFSTHIQKIPLNLTSPLLQHLKNEVLKQTYTPLHQDQGYQKNLYFLLMKTGLFQDAQNLLLTSNLQDKDSLLIDILWTSGETKAACSKIDNLLRTSPSPSLKFQNVYCLFLNGETERSKIAFELLKESSEEIPSVLSHLFNPSVSLTFDKDISESPFLLNIWCQIGQDISEKVLATLSGDSLSLISNASKMPIKTRVTAAQLALDKGVFSRDTLSLLLKEGPEDSLLVKFLKPLNEKKSEALLSLFKKAEQEKKLSLIGKAFRTPLSQIPLSSETLPLAPYLVRLFLSIGEGEYAQKWGRFYMKENPEEGISLLPLLSLSSSPIQWHEPQMKAWQAYQLRVHPKEASQKSYILKKVMDALGESTEFIRLPEEPSSLSWRQQKNVSEDTAPLLLEAAANHKRIGEVYLLILSDIGETSLDKFKVDKIYSLISALQKIGEKEKARFLALEYLLANGF